MIENILYKQAEIKREMTQVIHTFLNKNNASPSSVNVKIIPEHEKSDVCIQIQIKEHKKEHSPRDTGECQKGKKAKIPKKST